MIVDETQRLALDKPWLPPAVDAATRAFADFYEPPDAPSTTSVRQ